MQKLTFAAQPYQVGLSKTEHKPELKLFEVVYTHMAQMQLKPSRRSTWKRLIQAMDQFSARLAFYQWADEQLAAKNIAYWPLHINEVLGKDPDPASLAMLETPRYDKHKRAAHIPSVDSTEGLRRYQMAAAGVNHEHIAMAASLDRLDQRLAS